MTTGVIIIGAGGHARVLLEALELSSCKVLGFIDPAFAKGLQGPAGLPVLGGDEALHDFYASEVQLVNGVGSTGPTTARAAVYRRGKQAGFSFARVVHPSAILSASAILGEGAQIMAGCVVQTGAEIGANSIVNTRASVDHDCKIGETVHIAPGVTLSGNVRIGDRTHIGTGAVVIQGISIGADSLVAAGAVVYRDLPGKGRLIPGGH
jgi:sugar O-acyltransferase (sialic acid O-acetyltransferase NeuD family)